jgi:hypothetical protein
MLARQLFFAGASDLGFKCCDHRTFDESLNLVSSALLAWHKTAILGAYALSWPPNPGASPRSAADGDADVA